MRIARFAFTAVSAVALAGFGAGIAQAVPVAGAIDDAPATGTGSAELLPGLLEALASGSAQPGTPGDAASTAVDIDGETPAPGTGSAELLPGLLEALASGSASAGAPGDAASTAVDIDGETPTPGTGSADLLPTLLEGLLSGSAGTAPATPAA